MKCKPSRKMIDCNSLKDSDIKGFRRICTWEIIAYRDIILKEVFSISVRKFLMASISRKKFVADMLYGLLAGQSCFLTNIARKLKEKSALDKSVERLSRNLMDFDDANLLRGQYLKSITKHFGASTILIVDDSDISKAKSCQLQYLCRVCDGSTGQTTTGYCYAGVSALTEKHKQPLPVYGHVYSTVEESYKSNNHETLKSFRLRQVCA